MALSLLLLATPVFGLALEPPALGAISVASLRPWLLQLEASADAEPETDAGVASAPDAQAASAPATDAAQAQYIAQMKQRDALASFHRPLGIATWAAMTVTVGLGVIQYHNQYGFFADQGHNPCVQGDAIFGQPQCSGMAWPHAAAAGLTTVLYASAFTLELLMPDPDDLSSGPGEFAARLRLHKLLRWVHLGGMLAQVALGIVIAHEVSGLDRANDYDTLQALATVHMAAGLVTYGALSWAGALMTF